MNTRTVPHRLLALLLLSLTLLACNLLSRAAQPTQVSPTLVQPIQLSPTLVQPTQVSPTQIPPTLAPQPSPTTAAGVPSEPIRQWATDAEASSEYSSPDWAASQATGEPNTPECGDLGTAWAAASEDTVEWINLYYSTPVYPTEIRIIQTYNPDQVVQVDLIDMQGGFVTVYTGQPRKVVSPCPHTLLISVSRSDILVQGVRLMIDQSVLVLGWNEIDAVEIVGVPGEGTPVRPPPPTP